MPHEPSDCYDELAENYHLIFENWERSIELQAAVLGPILESESRLGVGKPRVAAAPLAILDCACGIGTQAIGLARRGHRVIGSDASSAAVARARREAAVRGQAIEFRVADMRDLSPVPGDGFDAVVAADNSLPHLIDAEDLVRALRQMAAKLAYGGVLLATVRDYDKLIESRPAVLEPAFFLDGGRRRIVHQVWDWKEDTYTFHLYLTLEAGNEWRVHHYASRYRAWQRAELNAALNDAGFDSIRWMEPAETSFYQPIVTARKRD